MKYKLEPIEIPEEDPFQFDALERKQAVESISSLLGELSGPFVLAIDSPWGTGKTTFIKMMMRYLEQSEFTCVYFNAWETDFSTDPLIAFVGEIGSIQIEEETEFSKHFNKAKKVATLLAKKALPVAGKIATAGALDLDNLTEKAISDYVSSNISDAVDAYSAEKELISQFHENINNAVSSFEDEEETKPIIIFVDELDRCRPTFAIELLERIKHLFNVKNVIFVLSLDKQQLQISLGAVYGHDIDSGEYLRRFIDLEYSLPKPDAESFTNNLYNRFGFDEFFSKRMSGELRYERDNFLKTFNALSDIFGLSLRSREQCFTRIRVAMMTTQENYFLYPQLLSTLAILKVKAPAVYHEYALGLGASRELVSYLRGLAGGNEFLDTHFGTVTESYLIAAKAGWRGECAEVEKYKILAADESLNDEQRERADKIVKIVTDMQYRDRNPSLAYVVNNLELAAQFKQ